MMSPLRASSGTGCHENTAVLAVTSRIPKEAGPAVGAERVEIIYDLCSSVLDLCRHSPI